jgi:molybdenum cofactor biosynthesis enzyme MoaA
MTISIASRQRIRQRANFLCEYCHSSEEASTIKRHLLMDKKF